MPILGQAPGNLNRNIFVDNKFHSSACAIWDATSGSISLLWSS
jgi:hypothetical protein